MHSASAPNSSVATYARYVLSTPPEKATTTLPISLNRDRRRSSFPNTSSVSGRLSEERSEPLIFSTCRLVNRSAYPNAISPHNFRPNPHRIDMGISPKSCYPMRNLERNQGRMKAEGHRMSQRLGQREVISVTEKHIRQRTHSITFELNELNVLGLLYLHHAKINFSQSQETTATL
jgi:hypothetical protein